MFNLYIFPRAMGSAWIVARGWGWVPHTGNYGDTLVCLSVFWLSWSCGKLTPGL